MWPMSGEARGLLAQSHTMAARVDVLHSGKPVFSLTPTGGGVEAEAGRAVMRNLSCSLADPTGELSGGDLEDLLSPYECELFVWRGVQVPPRTVPAFAGLGTLPFGDGPFGTGLPAGLSTIPGRVEWAPLGVFRPTGREARGDGSVQVQAQDRAVIYQGPMTGSLAISGGTAVEDAIVRLLTTRNPGVQIRSWATGFTCGPLLFQPDIDVWAEAQKLAQSVGGWLYHDRTGQLVFGPLLPTSTLPVARYVEGGGVLLSATRSEDSDSIHNVVVVQSTKTATGGVIRAVAEDTDATSPTYAAGRYGRRVKVITNEHVASTRQAEQAAATALVRELGRSESVAVSIVPDPALDPLDTAVVHRLRIGLVQRALVVQSVSVPLTATESMAVSFRKYVLTRDGSTLDTEMGAVS